MLFHNMPSKSDSEIAIGITGPVNTDNFGSFPAEKDKFIGCHLPIELLLFES